MTTHAVGSLATSESAKGAWHEKATRPIKSILVPIDYSEPSFRAGTIALAMARGLGASLTFLHLHISDVAARETVTIDASDIDTVEQTDLTRLMADLVSGTSEAKLESVIAHSHAHVAKGSFSPSQVIVTYAEAQGVDLIIMGARTHSRLRNLLLGDVAQRVIEQAHCPVMLLH